MDIDTWVWPVFGAAVAAMLVIDLYGLGRRGGVSLRRAVAWSVVWSAVGVAFGALLWVWQGSTAANEYLAGFLIEKSLSVDNLFVFAIVFSYFAVPAALQRRVLFWGIVGAVVLRGLFILAGAALLDAFHYTIYAFGIFLVITGIRMARHSDVSVEPEHNPVLRLLRRLMPITNEHHGEALTVRQGGRRMATPMLAALVMVATFDVIFAVDSIPAIFAVTRETFIVYAANAFSLLGLSALYFVLVGMLDRFHYLPIGLGAVLVFVGAKMTLVDVVHVSPGLSLAVIVVILSVAIGVSLRTTAPTESQHPSPV